MGKKNNNDGNENEFNHFDFGLMKNSSLSIRNALFDISQIVNESGLNLSTAIKLLNI